MLYESDWQVADAYNYLDCLGSTAFAWEFLRRNPDYQKSIAPSPAKAIRPRKCPNPSRNAGGCDFAVDPSLRAHRARVVWLPHLNPATVVVAQAPDEFSDARPINELTPAFSRRATDSEHWLIDHGGDALSLALIDGADAALPAAAVIPLDGSLPMRIEALRHLWEAMTGHVSGRTPDGLTAQQRSRLRLILRSLDGWLADCSYREIAKVLFGPDSVPAGRAWPSHRLHGQIRRLCDRGRDLMNGAYLDLLRFPRQFRC
jgi:hypothetical protein